MIRKFIYCNLTKKEIKKWGKQKEREWGKNANFWIKIIRENLDPFRLAVTNKAILESLTSRRKFKVLDVGCGEGYLCRILSKKGHQVFGIDFCPKLIKSAKDLDKKKSLGIKYFVRDFRNTSFPSSFFDVILSHQTINEVQNPEKALEEFFRILKKRGRLILLFLHPCFDIDVPKKTFLSQVYFQKTKIKKDFYLVSGIRSSYPYFYLHLPLSGWISILIRSGFSIKKIGEPRPSLKLINKNKWWKENFKKPLFILIEAIKL